MYPTSTAFKSAVRGSHKAIVKAEVWKQNQKILDLNVDAGSVEIDARRTVRRTCQLRVVSGVPQVIETPVFNTYANLASGSATYSILSTKGSSYGELVVVVSVTQETIGESLVPENAQDVLAPLGNEIKLWRGVELVQENEVSNTYAQLSAQYATYSVMNSAGLKYGELVIITTTTSTVQEYVPLGVFQITNVEIERGDNGMSIVVSGADRSLRVSRARWTNSYKVAQDTNVATAIGNLLSDRYADVETSFVTTTAGTGSAVLGTETDNDPWQDAQKIAESAGLELFFDGTGVAVLQETRDFDNASPDAVYRENDEAMVLSLRRKLTNEQTYNGVVVTAESTSNDTVFRVEAWDDDPESPTYRYGSFGQVPFFYYSPLIRTQDQATSAATARLQKVKGVIENVDWTQITDPSLDVGDVIAVYNTDTKLERLMVLDRLTIPLRPSESMSAVARTVRSLNGVSFAEEAYA